MLSSSPNLVLKEPTASVMPHILLWPLQICALTSPPFPGRRLFYSAVIIGLAIYCNLNPHFTNNFDLAQPFSLAWSFYAAVLAKIIFSRPKEPEDRFWRIDKPAGEARDYAVFGWQKLRWTASLMFNHRGIRWVHQVKNIPKVGKPEKSTFLIKQVFTLVYCVVMGDLFFYIHQRVNFTPSDGRMGFVNSKFLTLRHENWRWSIIKTFSLASLPYFGISMQFALVGFVSVLIGVSKPEDWPPPFGTFRDLRTIRSFWGKFWHQQLRHMLTSYTDAFANVLGIQRGSNMSSYTKLYLAFFISGAFHALGQLHLPRPANIGAMECSFGFFVFFVWQAVAITIEDFVIWMWRHSGLQTDIRFIGYAWVFLSLWLSFPFAGNPVLKLRIGTGEFAPFPLTKPLVTIFLAVPT